MWRGVEAVQAEDAQNNDPVFAWKYMNWSRRKDYGVTKLDSSGSKQ